MPPKVQPDSWQAKTEAKLEKTRMAIDELQAHQNKLDHLWSWLTPTQQDEFALDDLFFKDSSWQQELGDMLTVLQKLEPALENILAANDWPDRSKAEQTFIRESWAVTDSAVPKLCEALTTLTEKIEAIFRPPTFSEVLQRRERPPSPDSLPPPEVPTTARPSATRQPAPSHGPA